MAGVMNQPFWPFGQMQPIARNMLNHPYRPQRHRYPPRAVVKGERRRRQASTFVDIPGSRAMVRAGYVERHLPDLFKYMVQSGNRVADPLFAFRNSINSPYDQDVYSAAVMWIWSRNPETARGKPIYNPQTPHDVFESYRQDVNMCIQSSLSPVNFLEEFLDIYQAVGEMLRDDRGGFGCGPQIFDEFLQVGKEFTPLVAESMGFYDVYRILDVVQIVAGDDERILLQFLNTVPYQERSDLIVGALSNTLPSPIISANIFALYRQGLIS